MLKYFFYLCLVLCSCQDSVPKFKGYEFVKSYPTIKDSAEFIQKLKTSYSLDNADEHYPESRELVTRFDKIKLYGNNLDIFLIEYSTVAGPNAGFPWKTQLIFDRNGRLLGQLYAVSYDTISIIKNSPPFLLATFGTSHGHGWHEIYAVKPDTLNQIFTTFFEKAPTTYGASEHYFNDPFELPHRLIDDNNDGYMDIMFFGKLVFINAWNPENHIWYDCEEGFKVCYDREHPWKVVDVNYVFLYDSTTVSFKPKEDYSNLIESIIKK